MDLNSPRRHRHPSPSAFPLCPPLSAEPVDAPPETANPAACGGVDLQSGSHALDWTNMNQELSGTGSIGIPLG